MAIGAAPTRTSAAPTQSGRRLVALSRLLAVVGALLRVVWVVAVVEVARALVAGDGGSPWLWAVVVAVAVVIADVTASGSMVASFGGARRIVAGLRAALIERLERLPLGWFSARSSGLVRQAAVDDLRAPSAVYSEVYVGIARAVTLAVASSAYLLWLDPVLAPIALAPAVIAWLLRIRSQSEAVTYAQDARAAAAVRVQARATELVQGAAMFRLNHAEAGLEGRLQQALREEGEVALRASLAQWHRARWSVVTGERVLAIAVVLLVAIVLWQAEIGTPVDLIAFVLLGDAVGNALAQLAYTWGVRKRSLRVLESYDAVLAESPLEVTVGDAATPATSQTAAIEMCELRFGYRPGHPVFDGLSLRIEQGTTVALVGGSGAGKTTLARLIPRFWDAEAGAVRVLGDDVRELEPAELYRRVGFVFQGMPLLHRSIRDNLTLVRAEASDADLTRAAQAARIHDRILALPCGYDSVVGEDAELSGGQTQRIGIARALLADPPILVLDEPTSHADAVTDAAIGDSVTRHRDGTARTVVMITHRLASVRGFDRIVVLDGGRITEDGTHDTLLAAGGTYARLWRNQARAAAAGEQN